MKQAQVLNTSTTTTKTKTSQGQNENGICSTATKLPTTREEVQWSANTREAENVVVAKFVSTAENCAVF